MGGGAVGLWLAAQFWKHDVPALLVTHTAEQADLIRRDGVAQLDAEGEHVYRGPATQDLGSVADAAWVILALKSYAVPQVLPPLAKAAHPSARLAVIANGLTAWRAAPAAWTAGPIYAVLAGFGATRLGPRRVRTGGLGPTVVARLDGVGDPTASKFAACLADSGVPAEAVADPWPPIWRKLAVNAAVNPLTTLLGCPNGELLAPRHFRVARRVAEEVAAVARAAGVPFGADAATLLADILRATADNRSSMLQDWDAGRPLELDAITGAVLEEAARVGVPVPVNRRLYTLVTRCLARRAPGSPPPEL